jgi:hypothetical protein
MCDGPVNYIGDSATTLELLPPSKRSSTTFSKVEIPYALKLLEQEMGFYLNSSMRFLTEHDVKHLRGAPLIELTADQQRAALAAKLPERTLLETTVPERLEKKEEAVVRPEDLSALGFADEGPALKPSVNSRVLNAAVEAAVNAALTTSTVPGKVNSAVVNAAVNAAIAASNEMPAATNDSNWGSVPPPPPGAPGSAIQQAKPPPLGALQFTSAAPTQTSMQAPTPLLAQTQGLGEDDYDAFPEDSDVAPGLAMPQQQQQQQSQVNVQTTTQPVLVVPLNMAQQQTSPAEYLGSAVPGAPPTFAVDTGPRSMASAGLPAATAAPTINRRSASRSPGATRAQSSQINSATAPSTRVNVIKEG